MDELIYMFDTGSHGGIQKARWYKPAAASGVD